VSKPRYRVFGDRRQQGPILQAFHLRSPPCGAPSRWFATGLALPPPPFGSQTPNDQDAHSRALLPRRLRGDLGKINLIRMKEFTYRSHRRWDARARSPCCIWAQVGECEWRGCWYAWYNRTRHGSPSSSTKAVNTASRDCVRIASAPEVK